MVENNYFFYHSTIFIIIIVPLLTLCGKNVKQSHCPWAVERFESSLLTLQGKPNTHAWGAKSPTQHFPFLLVSRDRPTALDYEYNDSAPADGGVVCPTPRYNQVLKLTDYHISRHVVNTFKRLTTTTTHCGLSTLSLNRRGPMIPPWALWLQHVVDIQLL